MYLRLDTSWREYSILRDKMPTYRVIDIVNCEPVFGRPRSKETISVKEILADVKFGGALKTLTPLEYITEQQRRWYKGVCLRDLVKNDENGETMDWWDTEVKRLCGGLKYLKKEIYFIESYLGEKIPIGRLTTKSVGKKKMTNFIEEILSVSLSKGWDVAPPDKDLRKVPT